MAILNFSNPISESITFQLVPLGHLVVTAQDLLPRVMSLDHYADVMEVRL